MLVKFYLAHSRKNCTPVLRALLTSGTVVKQPRLPKAVGTEITFVFKIHIKGRRVNGADEGKASLAHSTDVCKITMADGRAPEKQGVLVLEPDHCLWA